MSLHTIYATPKAYRPTGMWNAMIDSLMGEEAIWPGGFPKRENDYCKLTEWNNRRGQETMERLIVAMHDTRLISAANLGDKINLQPSRTRAILGDLMGRGIVQRVEIDNKHFWSLA